MFKANKVLETSFPTDREFIALWYYEEEGVMYIDGAELYIHFSGNEKEPIFMNLNSSNQNDFTDGKNMFTHWIEIPGA